MTSFDHNAKTRVLEPVVLGPSVGLNPSSTCLKAFCHFSLPPFTALISILFLRSFPCSSIRTFLVHSTHTTPPTPLPPLFYMAGGGGSPTNSRHGNGLIDPCLVQYFHLSLGEGEEKERALRHSLSLPAPGGTVVQSFRTCFFQKPLCPN